MKLKNKLPIFTSLTVFVTILIIAGYSIYNFRNKTIESIEVFRVEETEKIKSQLKDIVYIAHSMIEHSYKNSTVEGIKKQYGLDISDTTEVNVKMVAVNMLKITLENLRVLRFGVDGYLWINELNPPYRVVMHGYRNDLEGKPPHPDYLYLYIDFEETVNKGNGEGFYPYEFTKPNEPDTLLFPKLSYLKLFEPLGWVIGTGVYIDHIDNMVAMKTEALNKQIEDLIVGIIILLIILIIIASIILYYFGKSVVKPIEKIKDQLYLMSKGQAVEALDMNRRDEIGQMKESLDELIKGFALYSNFALEIGKGNLDSEFTPLSDKDILGNSLIEMRQSLKKAQHEEEVRKEENRKRQWAAEGQALFGDILRSQTNDLKQLSEEVLMQLIRYLNAELGGIFIMEYTPKSDIILKQYASIAYNKIKYSTKEILLGEGLLGACFLEKETIYMTKIPDDYIEIHSGLGSRKPNSLVIVPMILEGNALGVVEIASFQKLKPYEIEFIEKIAQSYAISIASVRMRRIGKNQTTLDDNSMVSFQ